MSILEVAVISVAAARISRMLLIEHGPGNFIGRFRKCVGAECEQIKPGGLAQLFNCPWCMTLWWTVILFWCYNLNAQATVTVSAVLAASMLSGVIVKATV